MRNLQNTKITHKLKIYSHKLITTKLKILSINIYRKIRFLKILIIIIIQILKNMIYKFLFYILMINKNLMLMI